METIFSDITISMSEFKKNPASVLRQARNRPVAVLNHNRAAFYLVEPRLFEAMLAEMSAPAPGGPAQMPPTVDPTYRGALTRLGELVDSMAAPHPAVQDN
jgi:hypothetical protein